MRESRVSAVDEAMAYLDGGETVRKSQRGFGRRIDNSLLIDGMTSGGKSAGRVFHITCSSFSLSPLVIEPIFSLMVNS